MDSNPPSDGESTKPGQLHFFYPRHGGKANTEVLREGYGRIYFANSEYMGLQSIVGALTEGQRAARQAVAMI